MIIYKYIYHLWFGFVSYKPYSSCYVNLRGFILKVVSIPSRFRLQGFNTFEVSPSRLLSLFTFEVSSSRLLYLPLRFHPQCCYHYLPSRFRPCGCYFHFWGFALCFFLGIYRACWCVNFLSDMACPCSLLIIILIISSTISNLVFQVVSLLLYCRLMLRLHFIKLLPRKWYNEIIKYYPNKSNSCKEHSYLIMV